MFQGYDNHLDLHLLTHAFPTRRSSDLPGALFKLLQPFAESGLDLTRLESREIRNSVVTDYYFFVDFAGHAADPKVRAVLETIRSSAAFFKILGSYPRAVM